ncbi:MAG TPA: BatA and WFA domain-containing protein [Dictyoglomaceae bacterium]|nr:BatA and WFA domain-containing protein [Dictyoglomaceae bacterium]
MSFRFLNPSFLFLSLLGLIVVILYLIKPKKFNLKVPSLLMWEKVLREEPMGRWFKKLPKNILLFIQLLIVFFIVLALSKPEITFSGVSSKPLVIILDSSGSMASRDISPSRFEKAKLEAIDLLNSSHRRKITYVVSKGKPSLVLSSNSTGDVERAIREEKLFYGEGDLNATVKLCEGLYQGMEKEIHIFTDGSFHIDIPQGTINDYHVHVIGKSKDNVGIIDGKVFQKNEKVIQVFLKVGNFSDLYKKFPIKILNQGKEIGSVNIELKAQEIKSIVLDLPTISGKIEALLNINDTLLEDNRAFFYVNSFSPKILLVTLGNPFLEKALRAIPLSKVDVKNNIFTEDLKNYDFVVFDQLIPYTVPSGNYLFIGGYPELDRTNLEEVRDIKMLSWEEHPIMKFVQPYYVKIDRGFIFEDRSLKPLIYTDKGPMVFLYEQNGAKGLVFCFDLYSTSWIYHDSFPIFMYNLVRYYLSYDPQKKCGDESVDAISPGFYEINMEGKDKIFAVNIFSQKESDIAPKFTFESKKEVKKETGFVSIQLSSLFLILALLLFSFEAVIFLRGWLIS